MIIRNVVSLALCLVTASPLVWAAPPERILYDFASGEPPTELIQHDTTAKVLDFEGGKALEVNFTVADWPNVYFAAPQDAPWDWSAFAGLAFEVYNPEEEAIPVSIRVDNADADGAQNCNTASGTARPRQRTTITASLASAEGNNPFWGMRGVPLRGPVSTGPKIDTGSITAFQLYLARPTDARRLLICSVRLVGQDGDLAALVPLPFVDAFGQYVHDTWPGKLTGEAEFEARRAAEESSISAKPTVPGLDRFGGWMEGPQLEATGSFRTQQVDGKWWLVTPEGHLFFSSGIDTIGTWSQTFVDGRSDWFSWLPPEEDPVFQHAWGKASGAHSMAETIGGEGRTFGFYSANLRRKYGEGWRDAWRESVYDRLRHWGFNTLGNWTQQDVLLASPIPFVAPSSISGGVPIVQGAKGYWGHMRDAFSPEFAENADGVAKWLGDKYGNNPYCIGFFVDNEIGWGTLRRGVLDSPPDQPARQAFIATLQDRYGDLAALNAAWEMEAISWNDVRAPQKQTAAARRDIDALVRQFADRYFQTLRDAFRRHAPGKLYLGCRFADAPRFAVESAAVYADVVSFNLYNYYIPCEKFSGAKALEKPILIGEYHFGAMDRGMFHPGLVQAEDQTDRAAKFKRYLESVIDCPAFVGAHWFQYVDEPITGRWYDGENYNIGFVDVTDTPYPEMVKAAQQVHAEMYTRRYRPDATGNSPR